MSRFPFGLPPRYEFKGERLQGGQGCVFICRDLFLERDVAIKVMSSISDTDKLKAELAAMRDIRSPHVAEIYDLIIAKRSSMAGLIQEYVAGPTLEEYAISAHDMTSDFRTLWQLAKGIQDIHNHKKLHRDIKPSNARFDAEGVLKILDFGIVSDAIPEGVTVNSRGTRGFLGPEFYAAPPIRLTPAGDVYAFGVTVWCIASKMQLPSALMEVPPHRNEPVSSLGTVLKQWPKPIVELLDRTLTPNPVGRPSIQEVRQALERQLLQGKHRAAFNFQGTTTELKLPGRSVKLQTGTDSIVISYDGLEFAVKAVTGDVYVNNTTLIPGSLVPASCVFTLGAPELRHRRTFVSMDISHPEVIV